MVAKLRTILLVLAIALLVQAPESIFAQSDGRGTSQQPIVLNSDDAYLEDAQAYVAEFGGPLDIAIQHLKLQGTIADLDTTLQTKESGTFAGLWIEHAPRFRVVVLFTRGGKEAVLPYIQDSKLLDLVDVQAASTSLGQLRTEQIDLNDDILAAGVSAESYIDVKTNGIKVYATNRDEFRLAVSIAGYQTPGNVTIMEVPKLAQQQTNWYAGYSLAGCTSGFSLYNVGFIRYSSTAGHCMSSSISPLGAPILTVTSGKYDFQVNPAPAGDTIKNWAADNIFDSTPYYREITSWGGAAPGTFVCKYGRTTGYTCGTVESNTFTYNGSATYTLVDSSNPSVKVSCPGDSGAPIYTSSTAIAELVGGWCDLSPSLNKFFGMGVVYYRDYGYTVMTVP